MCSHKSASEQEEEDVPVGDVIRCGARINRHNTSATTSQLVWYHKTIPLMLPYLPSLTNALHKERQQNNRQ